MSDDLKPFLPLAPTALHILLCLSAEARHGYGIMQDFVRQSNGQYKLGPGTLYDNLQKLMDHGLVEEHASKMASDDARRRYYAITELGRSVLQADVERLKNVVPKQGDGSSRQHESSLSWCDSYTVAYLGCIQLHFARGLRTRCFRSSMNWSNRANHFLCSSIVLFRSCANESDAAPLIASRATRDRSRDGR